MLEGILWHLPQYNHYWPKLIFQPTQSKEKLEMIQQHTEAILYSLYTMMELDPMISLEPAWHMVSLMDLLTMSSVLTQGITE